MWKIIRSSNCFAVKVKIAKASLIDAIDIMDTQATSFCFEFSSLISFHSDLLGLVFAKLDACSRLSLRYTCRRFHQLIAQEFNYDFVRMLPIWDISVSYNGLINVALV